MGIYYFKLLNILLTIIVAMWYTECNRFWDLDSKAMLPRFKTDYIDFSPVCPFIR